MREILAQLFKEGKTTSVFATVKERLGPRRYLVADPVGRQLIVGCSGEFYPPGAQVLVQDKRIVYGARPTGSVTTLEV